MNELAAIDLTAELPRIRAPLTVVYASLDRARRGRASTAASPALMPAPATPAWSASTIAAT